MAETPTRTATGYPLVALFLLLTACGIVAALLGPAVRAISSGDVGLRDAVSAAIGGSLTVAFLGGVIGVFHYRRGRGLLWGLLVGAVLGLVAGPLMLAPASAFASIMALSFGGSVVIILMMIMYHLTARR